MMLHEAVMLEIYRQALSASELVSPRCQSRDSNAGDVRCSSNDSVYSAQDATVGGATTPTAAMTPTQPGSTRTSPQIEIPLPATMPPAVLLPTQSAAMAAYLNAANHLFLTNPLAASLVQTPAARSMLNSEETALDFSVKADVTQQQSDEEELDEEPQTTDQLEQQQSEDSEPKDLSTPLDLSCSARKRQNSDNNQSPKHKIARINDFKTWATPSLNPYLAAVAAASLSPKMNNNDWKKAPANEAAKALERMTEMTRLGVEKSETTLKPQVASHVPATNTQTTPGRHSAWQSHWLNKGAHSVKDVFKCVWCKQSFPTLATLTTHMKETKHCGVNLPTNNNAGTLNSTPPAVTLAPTQTTNTTTTHSNNNNAGNKKSDLNLLIKETMPLPRKLVRGQDVWLGKGAEQTRQILKCMWCGQSFRSLAEMTAHMQETQHYTNIISQEQIISWKSTDDKTANGAASPSSTTSNNSNNLNISTSASTASNTVCAVLTCKVCDQAFASLKELSNHMVKNSHYKDTILRQSSESPGLGVPRRGRQMREKRKKSLPVRKLLEMERAGGDNNKTVSSVLDPALKPLRDFAASTKITCEKCGEKIETVLFVEHIRQCLGGMLLNTPRHAAHNIEENKQTIEMAKESEKSNAVPSVLNAIEQLIEKSFDIRPPRTYGNNNASNSSALGSSILKRLGIDDNVDYTKPLMDAHALRYRSSSVYSSVRDRSASESSSVSERCSSSLLEPVTPEGSTDKCLNLAKSNSPLDNDIKIKTEPLNEVEKDKEKEKELPQYASKQKITVKKEFNELQNVEAVDGENMHNKSATPLTSPALSERSITPTKTEKKSSGSSLTALSSMFDSLNNTLTFTGETNNNNNNIINNNNNNNNSNKVKKNNGNPLAALQKLCENTSDPPVVNSSTNNNNANSAAGGVSSGMLGYGWDAETMTKCAYCDTSFYTKGAYRHHLQKVHFIKGTEEMGNEAQKSPTSQGVSPASNSGSYDESPQSKFRKYTELAKQLSSKNN